MPFVDQTGPIFQSRSISASIYFLLVMVFHFLWPQPSLRPYFPFPKATLSHQRVLIPDHDIIVALDETNIVP